MHALIWALRALLLVIFVTLFDFVGEPSEKVAVVCMAVAFAAMLWQADNRPGRR